MFVTEHTACRVCGGTLGPLLNLGTLTLPAYVKATDPDPESAPLDLVICERCDLVQLRHAVDNDTLYRRYWYQSGINESMRLELEDVVAVAKQMTSGSGTWLDVGANDGTLLRLVGRGQARVAVEPSLTFKERLSDHADVVISDYFPSPSLAGMASRSVGVLTSIAMFYDLDDPRRFVEEVDRLLAPDGVWIVQMQDLAQMVSATAYDNVCVEHRAYYSTATFRQMLVLFDLEILGVETRAINGGSLRYYITRRHRHGAIRRGQSGHDQMIAEAWLTRDRLQQFARDVTCHQRALLRLLREYQAAGQAVDLYAASTKSSTLLQSCGIDHALVRCAVERSPDKIGLVTSGTRIPIISESDWRHDPAPVTLLGAWGFLDGVLRREADYIDRGGVFLVPLPSIRLIDQHMCVRYAHAG